MPLLKSPSKQAFKKNIEREMHAGKPQNQALAIAYSVKRHAGKKKKMADGGLVDADKYEKFKQSKLFKAEGGEIKAAAYRPAADDEDERELHMMDDKHPEHGEEKNFAADRPDADNGRDRREMDMIDDREPEHKAEKHFLEGGRADEDQRDAMEMEMMKGPHEHREELRAATERPVADDRDEMELDMLAEGGSVAERIRRKKMYAMGGYAEGGEVDLQDSNGDEHLNEEDQLSYDAARKRTYYDLAQVDKQPEDSNEHGDDIDSDEHDMVDAIRKKLKRKMK